MQSNHKTKTHPITTCTCRRHGTIPSVPRTKRTQRITKHVTHIRCVCTTVHTQCRCTTSTDTMRVERDTVHEHHAKTSQMHDLPTRHWMYDVCVLTGRPNTTVVRLEANGTRKVVWRTFLADIGHDTTTSQCACAPPHVNKQKTHVTRQSQPRTTIRESVHSKHLTASTCERTTHSNTNACYSNAPLNLPQRWAPHCVRHNRPCNTFSITTLSLSRTHLRVHLNRSLQKLHQQTFVH